MLSGDSNGWTKLLQTDKALTSIAKFSSTVFIAGGTDGLLKLEGSELVVEQGSLPAKRLGAGDELMIVADHGVFSTADFSSVRSVRVKHFAPMAETREPTWLSG